VSGAISLALPTTNAHHSQARYALPTQASSFGVGVSAVIMEAIVMITGTI